MSPGCHRAASALGVAFRLLIGAALLLRMSGCEVDAATGAMPSAARCDSLVGGRSIAAAHATDGDLATFVRLAPSDSMPVILRANARPGLRYPAGHHAGAWILASSRTQETPGHPSRGRTDVAIAIGTYRQGHLVESTLHPGVLTRSLSIGNAGASYVHFKASADFDAVELQVARLPGPNMGPVVVYELCSDGGE